MTLTWLIIKGSIDVSTADDDEDLDTNFFLSESASESDLIWYCNINDKKTLT